MMLGRAAYHDPWVLAEAGATVYGTAARTRADVVQAMRSYAETELKSGTPLRAIARHMLGLYHGQPNARVWRRMLSDPALLAVNLPALLLEAMAATAGDPSVRAAVI